MSAGVHLVLAGFAPNDAISNHAIEEQRLIRALGFHCEILSDPLLTHPARVASATSSNDWRDVVRPGDAIIVHYSIANRVMEEICLSGERVGLVYHNITPSRLLWRHAPLVAIECHRGRERLRALARQVHLSAADSPYNADELRAMGFATPVLTGILRGHGRHVAHRDRGASDPLRLLFVGRGVPNKAQHDLILALAALRDAGRDAGLDLAGGWVTGTYEDACRGLARDLDLTDRVVFHGSVTDSTLDQLYASADCFVCLSDHEGFCVPLVEAMEADLPIVAYAAGAVPWTVGAAGLILDDKRPSLVAAAIEEVVGNAELRDDLAAARRERLRFHAAPEVQRRIEGFVRQLVEGG